MGDNKKREFGTLIARHNRKGEISAWQARYQNPLDSNRRVQRNFPPDGKATAERWLEDERKLVEKYRAGEGTWVPPTQRSNFQLSHKSPKGLTFGEYCEWYCGQLTGREGKPLSPLTIMEHKEAIKDLSDAFANKPLIDISQRDIERWFDQASQTLSPHRLRLATMMLRRVCNAAVTDGLGDGIPILPANPCRIKTPVRELNARNERPLSTSEARKLASVMPEHLRLAIWMGLTVGGLHMSELCALRLSDIDFSGHVIHINRTVKRQPHSGYEVTDAYRAKTDTLPLPRLLEPAILNHANRYCFDDKNGYLFPSSQPWRQSECTNPTIMLKAIRNGFKKIGRNDGTYRTLRASYAHAFLRNGGTMREAMDLLGISTTHAMTQLCSYKQDTHVTTVNELCSCDFLPPDTDGEALETIIVELEQQRRHLSKTIRRLRNQHSGLKTRGSAELEKERT